MVAPAPAVLVLKLDTAAARRELQALDRERSEGRAADPGAPGARRASESEGGRGSEDQRARRDMTRDDLDPATGAGRVFRFGRGALSGNLAGEVDSLLQGAAATVPGGGAAYRAARMSERYGPAVAAAVEEMMPEPLQPVATAAREVVNGVAKTIGRAEAALSAWDETLTDLRGVARLQTRAGRNDPAQLAEFGKALYQVHRVSEVWTRDRGIYADELLGRAVGRMMSQRGALE